MFTPPAFVEADKATLHALIANHGFGMLVTVRDGVPVISHLPFMLDPAAGPDGTLFAHVARGNPQWRDFDGNREALAVFQGPHGYISPRWYRHRALRIASALHRRGTASAGGTLRRL